MDFLSADPDGPLGGWPKRISNEHALDVLLSPAPSNDGWRIITKKGIAVTFGAAQLRYITRSEDMRDRQKQLLKAV